MPTPRIAAVHDLSCYGRCSLTIALPVLSAMGCQCCPLPTALLSAHTGFAGGSFLDLTDEMAHIAEHWERIGLRYDGGCQYAELLISNYDTSERAKAACQLSLFDDETILEV